MLNFFYKFITPWVKSDNINLIKNRIIGKIANIAYVLYCFFPIKKNKIDYNVVVSLTTYPKRINQVYYCLNSLLRQKTRAYKTILWLSNEEFPNKEKDLPKRILKLNKFGLEIRFCENIKSYKKIFYTAREFKNKIIVTADDDSLYPEYWLEELIKCHNRYPNCIVCYRAHLITFKNNQINKYTDWNGLSEDIKGPSLQLIAIGVGGILYPPYFFEESFLDINVINKYAPTTDDIWLKIIQILKKIPVVKVNSNSKEWFTINSSQRTSLKNINVNKNIVNDRNDIAIKKLMNFYNIKIEDFGIDIGGNKIK